MPGSIIAGGARTPIGKLAGALSAFSATDLGGMAIKVALEKAGVAGEQVDYVIMGHVLQAGAGQITARQAAVRASIPMTVPAVTVNKVCLSGLMEFGDFAMLRHMIRSIKARAESGGGWLMGPVTPGIAV